MRTPWDRAAEGYLEEWTPRVTPYHQDLVRALALEPGARVLVTSAGPGAEVLAVARAVGRKGLVRATDKSEEMVRICRERVKSARLDVRIECAAADASDASGGPWDAIVCAFGVWQLPSRGDTLRAWAKALAPRGRVGVITWGPADPSEPIEVLAACARDIEPMFRVPSPRLHTREAMRAMFGEVGLSLVRHAVVRHAVGFESAQAFVRAMHEACTWRLIWEQLGPARVERIAARFYQRMGGPFAPVTFAPAATLAIAALPD